MKIAFFSDNFYPEISGVSDSVILTGQALARRGHSVHYFVPSYSKKNYILSNQSEKEPDLGLNITIHRMPAVPYPTGTLQGRMAIPNPFRAFSAKAKNGTGKFDIIHSHNFFAAGIDALMLSKLSGTPLVGTNHTLVEAFVQYSPIKARWVERLMIRYMMWYYNRCVVVSAPAKFLCDDMIRGGLKSQLILVSNPIEADFFKGVKTSVAKEAVPLQKNKDFTILYAGRIAPEKGVRALLEAFISIAAENPDMRLIFVGQGSIRTELEKRALESGFGNRIAFAGPFMGKKRDKLVDLFHSADVFAIPSGSEIQSMVVLQAMAGGLPTIGVRAGGLPDLIGDDKGILVKLDNAEAVADAIRTLHADPALRKKYGETARAFAEKRRADAVADEWEKIYASIASSASKNHKK